MLAAENQIYKILHMFEPPLLKYFTNLVKSVIKYAKKCENVKK